MKCFDIVFYLDEELKSTSFDGINEINAIDRLYEEYDEDNIKLVSCTFAGEYDKHGVLTTVTVNGGKNAKRKA